MSYRLPDAAATERWGAALARTCPWNSKLPRAIYLKGELGAGKTTLARGLLHALGVAGPVRSPSYALLEPYALTAGTVIHVDLYRIRDAAEAEGLGLRDEYRGNSLLLIEWPERGAGVLPVPDLEVRLALSGEQRALELEALTAAGQSWKAAAEAMIDSEI
jgi:tRNA threonylcarbamoyladenosine biosynthesis protein TsaE